MVTTITEQKIENKGPTSKERRGIAKSVISWIARNFKFILLPNYKVKDLEDRIKEYNKEHSQRSFITRLKSPLTIIGLIIIFVIASFAIFAPWLSVYSFDDLVGIHTGSWADPSPEHLLGTTNFGRDILGRIIWGARSSLMMAIPAVLISVALGVILGIFSAYYGGKTDAIIMRLMDIFFAFPSLILQLVLVSIFGPNMQMIILVYGLLGIPTYARLVRASVLQAKELPYVEAAKVSGATDMRIMFKHILPNVLSPVIISLTFDIGGIILSLAGLSFLGFSDATLIEWGNDIAIGRDHLYGAPWASFWPGFMIAITVLGFMLVGDGLRDALDPRLSKV